MYTLTRSFVSSTPENDKIGVSTETTPISIGQLRETNRSDRIPLWLCSETHWYGNSYANDLGREMFSPLVCKKIPQLSCFG